MIFDQQILMILLEPNDVFRKNPILWSDNKILISLAKGNFEKLWSSEAKSKISEAD